MTSRGSSSKQSLLQILLLALLLACTAGGVWAQDAAMSVVPTVIIE